MCSVRERERFIITFYTSFYFSKGILHTPLLLHEHEHVVHLGYVNFSELHQQYQMKQTNKEKKKKKMFDVALAPVFGVP